MFKYILTLILVIGFAIGGWAGTGNGINNYKPYRIGSTASSATPSIAVGTGGYDIYEITALAAAITSFTTNLTGTPVDGDQLEIIITDNGTARAITWGASFVATTVALPTTTVISTPLRVFFQYSTANSKWNCVGVA